METMAKRKGKRGATAGTVASLTAIKEIRRLRAMISGITDIVAKNTDVVANLPEATP